MISSRICPIICLFFFFSSLQAQSGLEQKYLQARIQERAMAQSFNQVMADSLNKSKKDPGIQQSQVLDSLLQGPTSPNLADSSLADSLPRRYSQRIFSRSPGSLFGSHHTAVGGNYSLGAGDEVIVSLWGDKEKQYSLTLNAAGKVFLEGIGLVSLNGMTVSEAEKSLRTKLSRIYSGIKRGTAFMEVTLGQAGPVKVFVLGEAQVPGGYVFTGNTSILTALYSAKGPTDIGTVRQVKLTRGSQVYYLDIYEYLLKGNTLKPNILQDGDILYLGRAHALVEVQGDVGRPAIYELKQGEGVKDLIGFAGGLNPTAATQSITLKRIFDNGKYDFIDLASPQDYLSAKAKYELQDGDQLLIEESTEPSENFITVTGPVKYEGTYESKGINTVQDIINKAGGLQKEVFPGRVHILRMNPDGTSQLFSHSLEDKAPDHVDIKGGDHVILYSNKDMYTPDSVEIAGAVYNPGKYLYSEGMTVKDLILRAGGYLHYREEGRAICFRPKDRERVVNDIQVKITEEIKNTSDEFVLNARDFVLIPTDPQWYKKEIVTLSGQFMYPGKYSLLAPGEKLASVIKRAGGLKPSAYVPGFRFHRAQNDVGRVAIDLARALKNKGEFDVPMMDGDSAFVPEEQMTVKVVGEVGYPTSVLFKKGKSVSYLNNFSSASSLFFFIL